MMPQISYSSISPSFSHNLLKLIGMSSSSFPNIIASRYVLRVLARASEIVQRFRIETSRHRNQQLFRSKHESLCSLQRFTVVHFDDPLLVFGVHFRSLTIQSGCLKITRSWRFSLDDSLSFLKLSRCLTIHSLIIHSPSSSSICCYPSFYVSLTIFFFFSKDFL